MTRAMRSLPLVLPIALLLALAATATAAEPPAAAENAFNAKLLKEPPTDQAADLAKAVGHWCIGTQPFAMGETRTGRAAGYAYWSLRCADGSAWVVQIAPTGESTAMDCAHFNAAAAPKACFKRF